MYVFSRSNIREMLNIGSNKNVAIVVEYHEIGKKGLQRYLIEKNNPVLVYQDYGDSDSGNPQTLINFIRWGTQQYQGKKHALVLWDHGTGSCLDPHISRSIDTSEAFAPSFITDSFDSNNAFGLPEFVTTELPYDIKRGCCFDDNNRSYFNNQGLYYALSIIKDEILHKLWDIIAWDACLMADVGTADITQHFAHYQVSSEQAEPGRGWRYDLVFEPFSHQDLEPEEFALHIVKSYQQTYSAFVNDYTLSVFKLSEFKALEQNINDVSEIALQCLHYQSGKTVKDALRLSYNRRFCTNFDEPNLKDLGHLYSNILKNSSLFKFNNDVIGAKLKGELINKVNEGLDIMKKLIIANWTGKSVHNAIGISIYAPETRVHSSFLKTTLVKNGNKWCDLMKALLIP